MAEIPDFDVDRAREDFNFIFDSNKILVQRIRQTDNLAGELGSISDSNSDLTANIYINIQGLTDAVTQLKRGITDKNSTMHAYVKHDTDIKENDIIIVQLFNFEIQFVINNYSPGMKGNGQFVFQDFDIKILKYNEA